MDMAEAALQVAVEEEALALRTEADRRTGRKDVDAGMGRTAVAAEGRQAMAEVPLTGHIQALTADTRQPWTCPASKCRT